MKVSEVLITPELATEYLKKNTNNRPINGRHLKLLVGEMESGRWIQNGSTICFSGDRLVDGQHRLHAILVSGISRKMLVVEGLDDSSFATIDSGKKRSAADALMIRGEKNYALLAATAVFVNRYERRAMNGCTLSVSPAEVVDLVGEYGNTLRDCCQFVLELGTRRIIAGSMMAGLLYIFQGMDEATAKEFFTSLISGAGLAEDSPILLLRQRLVSNSINKAKLKKDYIAALCIIAWNLVRQNRPCRTLKWDRTAQSFPVAI